MNYIIYKTDQGWTLKVYGQGRTVLVYSVEVQRRIDAIRILNWLQLNLKPEDKLLAA